jgi:pSer/pThr/pTyr-binding forkhead associated (FHA) protein
MVVARVETAGVDTSHEGMMPKLILQFEGRVLKEFVLGTTATIGRLPDNTVVIDNPAVSGHHARIVHQGEALVLEDLESTNGTFVNDQHVTRHALKHGDVILVGKHRLVFDSAAAGEPEAAAPAQLKNLGDTVYLDTKKHRALLATLRDARAAADRATTTRPAAKVAALPASTVGVLRVLSGRTQKSEYHLDAQTSLVGASAEALVRLQGWFKPKVAFAIARTTTSYVVTPLGGKTLVNNQRISERTQLKAGDILQVSGVTLEFRVEDRTPSENKVSA